MFIFCFHFCFRSCSSLYLTSRLLILIASTSLSQKSAYSNSYKHGTLFFIVIIIPITPIKLYLTTTYVVVTPK
ncbi:hypothetical protein ARMGADRAFT_685535 [Armillaria gallica]|uniref:Uncharacterized protein n=1 Tax=Armillaria gallica TaxID=47427 RepID=A0A2H3CWF4_ARMGA|nr:hypothetical protein ARMGADRAFT_685535 [Armillaria gallica]